MKSLIIAAVAALALPVAAQAQTLSPTTFYGSLGAASYGGEGPSLDLGAIQGRLGARFGQYFGLEGEVAKGVKGDAFGTAESSVKAKLNHQIAGYAVGYVPVSPNLDLFARVGYGSTETKFSGTGAMAGSQDYEHKSWNYGVGGQYFFDGKNGVRADFTRHDYKDSSTGADVWSASYVRKF